jgi:hypothetical protein
MEQKIIHLLNKYTKEEVYTKNYNDVYRQGDMDFIRVYNSKDPRRTYLANKSAFEILPK